MLNLRKHFSVLLVFVMVLSMATTSFASGNSKITVLSVKEEKNYKMVISTVALSDGLATAKEKNTKTVIYLLNIKLQQRNIPFFMTLKRTCLQ